MSLFETWCKTHKEDETKKRLWKLTEKAGGRKLIHHQLATIVRSHYDLLERIAEDVSELGYEQAAAILRERLPRGKKARSGDLGEILASEMTEEKFGLSVPVRRMRFKDGRETALRGDDFIGIAYDEEKDRLSLLKGEAKSRKALAKSTIVAARQALNRDSGRCTPISLLFVADRLMERGADEEKLGKIIRREIATKGVPSSRISHVLFTISGNTPPKYLSEDFTTLGQERKHYVVNIHIADHQKFIEATYEEGDTEH